VSKNIAICSDGTSISTSMEYLDIALQLTKNPGLGLVSRFAFPLG
jgi:hypothetical protein